MNNKDFKRLDYIDWAKACSIFLIVVAHFLPNNSFIRIIIYSFHVPIFFLISGMTINQNSNKKLFKRILIPYLIYYILSLIFIVVFDSPTKNDFLDILYIKGKIGLWNSVLWFFPCYFIVINLMTIVIKIFKNKIWISLIISSVISILFFYNEFFYYFGLNKIILLYNYCCIGYLIKNIYIKINQRKNIKYSIISFILFILMLIGYGLINKNNPISINQNDINDIIVYLVFSISECIAFIISLINLKQNKIIISISKNTLFIMSTHLFFRVLLQKIIGDNTCVIFQISGIIVFLIEVIVVLIIEKKFRNKILGYLGLSV